MLCVLIRIASQYTHNIPFSMYKKKNHAKLSQISIKGFFLGTQERVRNSRGKRAISVRAIEVLLYFSCFTERNREAKKNSDELM